MKATALDEVSPDGCTRRMDVSKGVPVSEVAAVDPSLQAAARALRLATPEGSLLVGAVGHLLLSREEESTARRALQEQVLPKLLMRAGHRPITLVAGMAPGADLLLMRELSAACNSRRGRTTSRSVPSTRNRTTE